MLSQQNELQGILDKIPAKYLPTILEYVKTIKLKAEKGELSDTEYLNSIPGITDSIIHEAQIDKKDYSENLDW